ncbi:hypothetical protein HNR60_003490 [Rhodopseudomonas rhenobacensis]|uniref:Uncharacterized protein n=1 Tax=Rhodopseudomonas rhenobacensis TaxID=87461 RepID=A0A7W8E0B5_9BRAD|nr:hypothetical protein [Rhodopseudomonas rhenobacensis]MBB5048722.1 hypothetical protein [Rhodopseudomonas rhenobacensis]
MLSLGDATLTVRTAGDLRLQTVLDPMLAIDPISKDPDDPRNISKQTLMFGYSGNSKLSLSSSGGNVTLVNQASYLSQDVTTDFNNVGSNVQSANTKAGNMYPALTSVVALNGSIENLNRFNVLPAAQGEVLMLAANDIDLGSILMSRATTAMLASPFLPFGSSALQIGALNVAQCGARSRRHHPGPGRIAADRRARRLCRYHRHRQHRQLLVAEDAERGADRDQGAFRSLLSTARHVLAEGCSRRPWRIAASMSARVEDGVTDLDEVLKDRLNGLKAGRDPARAVMERAKFYAGGAIQLDPALVESSGGMMREHLATGSIRFRKAYLQSIIDAVEADDAQIRIRAVKTSLKKQSWRAAPARWSVRR